MRIIKRLGLCLAVPLLCGQAPASFLVVDSVATLQASGFPSKLYPNIQTQSYLSGAGKGEAFYTWNTSSTTNDCAHIAVSGVSTGRYILRTDLQNGTILPTQCGAYFDGVATIGSSTGHDDSTAWNNTYTAAFNNGYVIGPVSGTSNLLHVVNVQPGVIFRGAGQGVENIQCYGVAEGQCFYQQNPLGIQIVEGAKFSDFSVYASFGQTLFQFNCSGAAAPCGFTDDNTTQAYMRHAYVERITSPGLSATGVQFNKCFECKANDNAIFTTNSAAIDVEGSDFTEVSHNVISGAGNRAIQLIQRGTFGNLDTVLNNDLARPRVAADSYIYSTARSADIAFNAMENIPGTDPMTTCEILVAGGFTVTLRQNVLGVIDSPNSICVNGNQWYGLDVRDNNVATGNGPAPLFNGDGSLPLWINNNSRTMLTHSGNRQGGDAYFPMSTGESTGPYPSKVYGVWTPSTADNVLYTDYGASLRVISNTYQLPAIASFGGLIHFPAVNIAGTFNNICFRSNSTNGTTTLNVQVTDNGSPVTTTTITPSLNPAIGWSCIAATISTGPAQVNVWNNDTVHNGIVALYEVSFGL